MNIASSREVILEPGVAEFLKRHAAEEEFQATSELARSCFPELGVIRVFLQEDPDVDDRCWVVLQITLPPSHPLDLLEAQRRRFSEEFVERVPPARFPAPVCTLMVSLTEDK
jgi:hypothetical protein